VCSFPFSSYSGRVTPYQWRKAFLVTVSADQFFLLSRGAWEHGFFFLLAQRLRLSQDLSHAGGTSVLSDPALSGLSQPCWLSFFSLWAARDAPPGFDFREDC